MYIVNNEIKLVIWDLDDTFWSGTISEEKIISSDYNIDLLKKFTDRGIVNSICSKNNFKPAKDKLVELGVWKYFVFPQISWDPKGKVLNDLIPLMGLRPKNVLFIDDNSMNLNEALYFIPDLNVCTPEHIPVLFDNKYLRGKNDLTNSRLKQYKNLEKKTDSFKKSKLSNIDFLKESNIVVEIFTNCIEEIDRISELVERTNQLNYTKKRVSKSDLINEINSPNTNSGYIKVKDKFGDYGISGFYLKKDNELIHFLFSCRTMNMYIESWLYKKLNSPKIIGHSEEVALELNTRQDLSFINNKSLSEELIITNTNSKEEILFVGGCDLDQVVYYLNYKNLSTDFNYVNNLNLDVRTDHTCLLLQYENLNKSQKEEINNLEVFSKKIYLKVFEENWDILIYSLLTDYSRGLYQNKNNGLIIPFDSFNIDFTDESNWITLPNHLKSLPKTFLMNLKNNYDFIGPITPSKLKENIVWLSKKFPERTIILINGSEVKMHPTNYWERNMHKRHIELNEVLRQIEIDNIKVIDVSAFISDESDVTDNIRHYSKLKYKILSDNIINQLNYQNIIIKNKNSLNIYLKRIKVLIKKIFSRLKLILR